MIYTKPLDKSLLKGFKYSPQTGLIFRNKVKNNGKVGPVLTQNGTGYRSITINGNKYLQHRLCFLFKGVDIPEGMCVDHLNGHRSDNRWENLRLVTHVQNSINRVEHREGTIPYIYHSKKRSSWSVRKYIDGEKTHFGFFKDKDEAIKERDRLISEGWPLPKKKIPKHIRHHAKGNRYEVRKNINGKVISFGRFSTEKEAENHRDKLVANNWKI